MVGRENFYTLCLNKNYKFKEDTTISFLVCHMEKCHKNDVAPVERENERDKNYISDNPELKIWNYLPLFIKRA